MSKNKFGEIQKIGVDAEALEIFRDRAEAGTREKRSANHLKTIRSNSGKTQKQVAEELGISLSAYRTYEQGTDVSRMSFYSSSRHISLFQLIQYLVLNSQHRFLHPHFSKTPKCVQ